MSVAYSAASRETTGRSGENYRDPTEASENLSEPESKASETKPSARSGSGKASTRKRSSKRTPAASKPLFSLDQLTVTDADELRRLMHESLRGFAVEMGVQVAASLLEEDVLKLCGKKSLRDPTRDNCRHGSQPGYVILGGQKVAIRRPRVRSIGGVEVDLDVSATLQSADAMPDAALTKMLRGVSCRDYEAVVETARAGFGVKKSSVSKNFVQASAEKLQEFDQRRPATIRRHHFRSHIH
jgi:putative transposase